MTIKNSTRLLAAVLTLAMMFSFVACDFFGNFGGSLKLESFIIDPNSYKAEYAVGEKIDLSGIQAIVKYNDEGLNKTYTFAELTFSNYENITAEEGTYEITVSFTDPHLNIKQEAKITIKVVEGAPVVTDPATNPTTDPTTDPATNPTTEPQVTEPQATEPQVTEPQATEPQVTEPQVTEPQVTEPQVTEPVVTEPEVTEPEEIEFEVIGFDTPGELVHFATANKNAGTLNYGQSGFSGQFAVGNQLYVIGTQGEFKFNPTVEIFNIDTEEEKTTKEFYSDVILSIKKDGAYVELTQTKKGNNVVEYYDGTVLIATVNTYKGTYSFTADAAGKQVKISVAPSEAHYYVYAEDFPPIVLEAKIINAYNVYKAWQLAVIDNSNAEWVDFKTANGIANLTVSGIVLHSDITLTANDVPASFFYTTTADVVYTNSVTGATVTIPAGTKYLKDGSFIYKRDGIQNFAIEGNFFTLDVKGFPLVPSPAVFGKDSGRDYGSDFSNAALIKFDSVNWDTVAPGTVPTEVSNVTVNNIALIGNAARDNLVDATESLASAGGLIFFKSSHYTNTAMNNVIGNSYFITYFVDYGATMTVTNSKCYDSYQNAAFVWANSTLNLINSYVNGCGGPAIIAQSVVKDNSHPVVNVTGSKIETHLGGKEIWFTAVNATAIVDSIKLIAMGMQQAGLGSFVDEKGQMNIMGSIMANGSSADEIVTGTNAQGLIFINGDGIDRTQSAENVNWAIIKGVSEYAAQASGTMPPFFTVCDATGAAYSFYFNGQGFIVPLGATMDTHVPLETTNPALAPLFAALMQADTITLTSGGLSVVFEYYHY